MTLPPTLIVGTADSDDDITAPAIYGTLAGEPIDGLAGDDAIYGDGGQPGGGDDVIAGGDGRDYLDGEDGDDLLEPGPMDAPVTANQTVRGGAGTDTLFLRGFPADYEFFDYPGGFIANARNANAPEGQVAAYSIERVAFGVGVFDYAYGGVPAAAIVDVAQLVPGLSSDRTPIALADTVTAGRGAAEALIPLAELLANDLDLDGDAFVIAELIAPAGLTVEGFDNDPSSPLPDVPPEYSADFPDGLVRVRLSGPLTAPVTFQYRLADASTGTLTGNTATVTLQPAAAPTAAADTLKATIGRDTFFSYDRLLANDGSGLTFLRIVPDSVVASGSVRVDDTGGGLRVTSFDTSPGTLSFTYEAADSFGNVASATVSVEVFNHAPIVADGAALVVPGSTYTLRLADLANAPGNFDLDADPLTVAFYSLTLPPTVTLMGFEDRIEFTFAADYAGDYALDFALADATGATDAGRFRFLTATPSAPVAVADTLRWAISGSPGQAFGTFSLSRLLANDSIAPGLRVFADPASFVQPANGILYVEPGSPNTVVPTTDPLNLMLSYMPRAGFTGLDTLTYDIVDELGRRSTTTLTFDVAVPAPVVPETTITLPAGATSVTFPVSALLTNATVAGPVKFSGYAIRFDENSGVLGANVDPATGEYLSFTYTPDPDTILGEDAFFIGLVDHGAEGGSARASTFVRFARATAGGATVALATADAGVTPEGNAANSTLNGPLTFEIVRTGDLAAASSVTFTLAAAPSSTLATEDIGLVAVGGNGVGTGLGAFTANFAAGQDRVTVFVFPVGDRVAEADEAVRLTLTGVSNGVLGGLTTATAVITNDDLLAPVFQITAAGPERVEEGTAPGTSNSFSVSVARRSDTDLGAAQVFIEIQGSGAAPVGLDDLVNGLGNGYFVDFAAGQMTATLSVPITPDSVEEADEFVQVVLSSSTYGRVDTTPYLVTIVNDDLPPPVFLITAAGPERVEEGTAPGTSNSFSVSVARDRGSDLGAARVFIEIQGTGAAPVGLSDLVNGLGNGYFVDFAEGQTTATLSVPITPDSAEEADEFVQVVLSSSTYGRVDTTPYLVTIVNDDLPPPVFMITSVGPERVEEGTAPGTSNSVSVSVTRARGSDLGAARVFIEIQGTGAAPVGLDDLVNGLGNGYFVDFAAGQMTATLSVPITPDSIDEPDEFVRVVLSSSTYGGVDETPYLVTIVNDDLPPPVFMITSVGPERVEEGTAPGTSNSFSVSVARDRGSDLGAARVFIEIQGTGATTSVGLDDLVNGLGNGYFVDFAEGQMTATLSVPITPDSTDEPDEFVRVTLSSSTYGEVDSFQYTVTILDDDTPQTADLSIDSRILVGGAEVGVDEFGSPAGTTYTVRLTVANAAGAAIAADARVRITFPDAAIDFRGLRPEDADLTVDDVSATGLLTLWWQVGALAPGASADLDLDLASLRPEEVSLVAEIVESTAPDPDSTPGNGTAAVEDDDLAVVLFGTPGAPPVVRADSFTVVEGGTLTLPPSQGLLVNDDVLRGSTITVSGSHPGVSLNVAADGGITFVAPSGITATSVYVYSYAVTDAFGQTSAPATIIVQVDDRPSPTGQSDTYVVFEGETLNISALLGLLANDAPATGTRVASTSAPNVGTVTVNPDGAFTFVAPAAVAEDTYATFDYVLVDAQGQRSAPIPVTVLVANRQLFADVSIEVLPSQPVYDFGTTQQSVTVRVRNDGPSAVDEIRVAFGYQDFTVANATTDSGTSAFDTGSGAWAVGPLAAGATADLVITSGTAPGGVTPRLAAEITQVRRSGEVVLDPDSTAGNGTGRGEDDEATATWTIRRPQADLGVVVRGPSQALAGQSTNGVVGIVNNSTLSVDNVIVFVNPLGLDQAALTPSVGSYDAATRLWTVGTLAPGNGATLAFSGRSMPPSVEVFARIVSSTVSGVANQDPDSTNDRESLRWRAVSAEADLGVVVRGPSQALAGQSTNGVVGIANNSTLSVDNVIVFVNPLGLNQAALTPSVGSYDAATRLWTVGTLAPGSGASLAFSGRSMPPDVEVFARIVSSTVFGFANRDPNSTNDRQSLRWRANSAEADLGVDVRGGMSGAVAGQTANATVEIANLRSGLTVDNVVVRVYAYGFPLNSLTPSAGSFDGATGLWSVGTLARGERATLALSGRSMPPYAEVFARIVSSTVFGFANRDPDSSNDAEGARWRVDYSQADLSVDVRRLSSTAPLVDQNVDVEVVVSSTSRNARTTDNVVVQLSPTNYLASTFTPSTGSYDAATGRWTVGSLAPGRQATLRIAGSSIQAGPAEVSASLGVATVFGIGIRDTVSANNADREAWTVPLPPRPSGLPDDYVTDEGVALVVPAANGLLANDGQSRFTVVHSVTQPTIGTLTYQADGSFTYTPPRHVAGDQRATFVYTLRDASGQLSDPVEVAILVHDVIAPADLSLAMQMVVGGVVQTGTAFGFDPGEAFTLRLVASNAGPGDADGVIVRLPLSDDDFDVLGTLPEDADLERDASGYLWRVGTLAEGDEVSLDIELGALRRGTFQMSAEIVQSRSPDPDSTPGNGAGEDDEAGFTVEVENTPPVAVGDRYRAEPGVVLEVSGPGVLGNDTDANGDPLFLDLAALDTTGLQGTLEFIAPDGSFRFRPADGFTGTTSFRYGVTDRNGGVTLGTVTLDVIPRPLRVASFEPTDSGVRVTFDQPLAVSKFNLYGDAGQPTGAPDLELVGTTTGRVRGSVVLDADGQGLVFVRTGGVLPPDTYSLAVRSGANGAQSSFGGWLDGNGDGTSGDDYRTTFTVRASDASVLSLPDVVRGPGQSASLPLSLTNAGGVTELRFDLLFADTDLALSALRFADGVSGNIALQAIAGGLHVEVLFDTPLGAGTRSPLIADVTVYEQSTYGTAHRITWGDITLRRGDAGALETVRGDDAVQVSAYFMDASGNRGYSMLDVQRLQRVVAGQDTGLSAYPTVDPVLIGDLNGNGQLTTLDVNRFLQFVQGQVRPEIPALPAGSTPLDFTGPTRNIALGGSRTATAGTVIRVPLTLDDSSGIESLVAKLVYDASRLEYLGARPGADFQFRLIRERAGEIVVDLARLAALGTGVGELLTLDFQVKSVAPAGVALVDLQVLRLNDGKILQSAPSEAGADGTDARITVIAPPPAPPVLRNPSAATQSGATGTPLPSAAVPVTGPLGPTGMAPGAPGTSLGADPVTPPTASSAEDWRKAPWAKDLARRLAQPAASTGGVPGVTAGKGSVLRTLTAALRQV